MRVAVVSLPRQRWDKYAWVAEALERRGHQVRRAAFSSEAEEAERWADVSIWNPKWLQNFVRQPKHCFRVGWMFDLVAWQRCPLAEQPLLSRHNGQQMDATPLLQAFRSCDLALVKERGLLGEYRELGVKAEWLDQGCPRWMGACEHPAQPQWDAVVLGTTRWKQRARDVRTLVEAGLSVAWATQEGNHGNVGGVDYLPFVFPRNLPDLFSRAAMVVDCGVRSDLDGYWSDKLWLVLGAGAFHLRRQSPGLPDNIPVVTYKDDLAAKAAEWRGRRCHDRRRHFGDLGRTVVKANHTYDHRVAQLEDLICMTKNENAACAMGAAR